jgi:hypothetical protein
MESVVIFVGMCAMFSAGFFVGRIAEMYRGDEGGGPTT